MIAAAEDRKENKRKNGVQIKTSRRRGGKYTFYISDC